MPSLPALIHRLFGFPPVEDSTTVSVLRRLDCLEYEDRTLFSATPMGAEMLVNTQTSGAQEIQIQAESTQAVAADSSGNFVVAWTSNGQDGDGNGVYAQRYDVNGHKLGDEIQANTNTTSDQQNASVAVDASGDFVVVWESLLQDGDGYGIFGQRYDATGAAVGSEFLINSTTANDQRYPAVAMDASGNFVVTWSSFDQDSDGYGIYGQLYDNTGATVGGEFHISTATAGEQTASSVAFAGTGDFIVVWTGVDADGTGVFGQRFNSSGVTQGSEFQINTTTPDEQSSASVSADSNGNFIVVWSSQLQDGSGSGVYGQRFNAAGASIGGEFQVNVTTVGYQSAPRVTMAANGGFVVSWTANGQDAANSDGIYFRQYDSSGTAISPETLVNRTTAGDQQFASLAMQSNDDFVVVWSGSGSGDTAGVFAQLYVDGANQAPVHSVPGTQTTAEDATLVFSAAKGNSLTIADANSGSNLVQVTLTGTNGNLTLASLTGLTFSVGDGTDDGAMTFTGTIADVNAAIEGLAFTPTADFNGAAGVAMTTSSLSNRGTVALSTTNNVEIQVVRQELVFIDATVSDSQKLIDDLLANTDEYRRLHVVILDAQSDGVSQITAALANYQNLSAIHFVTHASEGELTLGGTQLNNSNLAGYSEQIAQWRASLTGDADLLFYGCELAVDEQGRALLAAMEQLTGADVAASTDNTGNVLFAANWRLEYSQGNIETQVAFSETVQQQWMNVLNVAVDNTSSAIGNGLASVTISHMTTGTDRLMLVGISIDPHGNVINSVNYNGDSLTFIGAIEPGGAHTRVEIWALVAPDNGMHDVVVDVSGGSYHGLQVGVVTFTGVDQTTPLENFTTAFGNSTTASVTVASQTNDIVFGVVHVHDVTDIIADVGQTEQWDLDESPSRGAGSTKAGAASVTNTWTVGSDDWTAAGVSIRSANSNTSPTLNSSATPVLNNLAEDAGAPSGAVGTLVSSLVDFDSPAGQVDNITDPDASALLGIAVTAADTTNGSWWYSTDNGANWNALGAVTDGNARLLAADADTRIYFQANANYTGTITNAVTFRAWDQTTGTNGSLADASTNGGGTAFSSSTDTASLTVTAVNDAPVNTVPGAQSMNEDATLVFSSGNGNQISIADVDAGSSSVQVTLTATNGTVTLAGLTGLSFSVGDGTADATITFTGTVAAINTALNGLAFSSTADFVGAASLQIVTDDQGNTGSGGAQSDTDSIAITVNAVNDAPANTVPGPQSMNEDATLVFSSGNGNAISIADSDAGSSSVRVTLTATNGTVTLASLTGLSFSVGDGTADATMTFTGTITDVNTALEGLSFSSTPNFNGAASLQIVTNDQGNTGSGGAQSDTDSIAITVNAANDAPVNTLPGPQSMNEDATLVFSSGNGNQISIADADAAAGSVQVTLTATNGTLTLNSTTGLSFSAGDGTADATMTFTGTVAAINTALNGLAFSSTPDFSGAASVQIVTDDQGNTGSGGALSDTDAVAITVDSVNDAPILNLPASQSTPFRTELTFATTQGNGISLADVDAGSAPLRMTIAASNGTVSLAQLTGLTLISGTGADDATVIVEGNASDLNAAVEGMTFTPSVTYRGTTTISVSLDDLGSSGLGGPQTASGQIDVDVQPASQRLEFSGPTQQAADNFNVVFSTANGNALQFYDVYEENPILTVTIEAANGSLALSTTQGLVFSSGNGSGASMSFTGSLNDVNAALAGAQFSTTVTDSSLMLTASDPLRDATGSQSAGTTIAITQPAVYPSPSPAPVTDSTVTETTSDSETESVAIAIPLIAVPTESPAGVIGDIRATRPPPGIYADASLTPVNSLVLSQVTHDDPASTDREFEHRIVQSNVRNLSLMSHADRTRGALNTVNMPWGRAEILADDDHETTLADALVVGTAGITASMSVGYVLWSMRAASLLSTMLSSMPAWQTFDPLPVIDFVGQRKDEDDDDENTQKLFAHT
jgi:hypothetical protein